MLRLGELEFDQEARKLSGGRGSRTLTAKEAAMFAAIADGGLFVPRAALKRHVWGDAAVSDGTFNKLLHQLRAALGAVSDGAQLVSIYGSGVGLRLGAPQTSAG